MEFLTDFISNSAVILIALVTVSAFIAKLIIGYVSKDKGVIVPASELIDEVADKVIEEIKDIKAENDLKNPNVKEGFQVIDKPKRKVGRPKKVTALLENGNIINDKGEIIGEHKTDYKPDTYKDIIERESK